MCSKSKIAFFFFGDVNYDARCFNMIQSLSRASYKIDVFHRSKQHNVNQTKLGRASVYNVETRHPRGWKKFYEWGSRIKKISISQYDIIVASDIYSLLGLKNKQKKTKIIYDVRDFFDQLHALNKKPFKKIIWKFLEKKHIKNVHTILATSSEDELYLKKKFNYTKNLAYTTLYNFPFLQKTKKTNYLREHFLIPDHQHILIYQGTIQEGRGINKMLDCIKGDKTLCAVMVGDGENKKYYKKRARLLGVEKRFFFHKAVKYDALFSITCSADLGCALLSAGSTNNEYAVPNKIFEYAHSGLPVITSSLSIMKKYVEKFQLGKTADADNIKELKKTIYVLLNNREAYIKSGFLENFSWQKQEKQFLNLF